MPTNEQHYDPVDPSHLSWRAEHLLRHHVRNPEAVSHEEVQHLAQECEAGKMALESENEELRKTVRRLESYRDRYVDLYDFAPLGYVTLDEDGFIQEMNITGAEMLGVARDAVTGYDFAEYVAGEQRAVFRQHVRRCVEGRGPTTSELTLAAKDGRVIPVQLHSLPVREGDSVTFCKTAITDLTERKEMEKSVQQSREFLQTVIDTMPDAVLVIGQNYHLVLANRAAREMAGTQEEAAGCPCYRFLHHRSAPCGGTETTCPSRQVMESKQRVTVVHAMSDAQGKPLFYEVTAVPVFDDAGDVAQIIETCRDVTERQRVQQQLRELNETLERRVAERTTVAQRRAAQLRALSAQLAQTEQRERRQFAQVLHDQVEQLLSAAKHEVDSLQRLAGEGELRTALAQIEQLLEVRLAESNALVAELSPPLLYDEGLVAAVGWLAGYFAQKHHLTVHVESDPRAEPTDEATRVFLFEAVRELLLNVVHHARANHAWVELALTDDGRLRLEVRDRGRGFDPNAVEARGDPADRFGLLTIRERLELLGGRFHVESHLGEGTDVILLCPVGQPRGNGQEIGLDGMASVEGHVRPGTRVMVVDDHPVLRRGLADMLAEQPEIVVVAEAADGEQAVELVERTRPDVVLMDISMPKLGGIEATRRIKASLPGVRVIALSGHEEEELEAAMRAAGADAYLLKTVPAQSLIDAILEAPAVTV